MGGAGAGQPTCKIEPYLNNFQENGVSGQEKHLPKQTISTFIVIKSGNFCLRTSPEVPFS